MGKSMTVQHSVSGELCGGSFVTDSGQMNSPNVSNDGPDDLIVTCEWTIRKENKTIELHVMRMDLEEDALCLENYVSVNSLAPKL